MSGNSKKRLKTRFRVCSAGVSRCYAKFHELYRAMRARKAVSYQPWAVSQSELSRGGESRVKSQEPGSEGGSGSGEGGR